MSFWSLSRSTYVLISPRIISLVSCLISKRSFLMLSADCSSFRVSISFSISSHFYIIFCFSISLSIWISSDLMLYEMILSYSSWLICGSLICSFPCGLRLIGFVSVMDIDERSVRLLCWGMTAIDPRTSFFGFISCFKVSFTFLIRFISYFRLIACCTCLLF